MRSNIFISGHCNKCGRERRFCVCIQKSVVNPKKKVKKHKPVERLTIVRQTMFPLDFIRHETGWDIEYIYKKFEKWKTKTEKNEPK